MTQPSDPQKRAIQALTHHTEQLGEILLEVIHPSFNQRSERDRLFLWRKVQGVVQSLKSLKRSSGGNP